MPKTGKIASGSAIRVTARCLSFHVVRDEQPDYPIAEHVVSAASAAEIARHVIGDSITEILLAMFLDARQRIIGFAEIARGTLNVTRFTPRDVLVPALRVNAHSIVLAHNHPTGDPSPSRADHDVTATLREAAQLIGVRLADHLIVTNSDHYSFAQEESW